MRVAAFGTYDVRTHPRVAVLIEGLVAHGADVVECNEPLGFGTDARVEMLRRPWKAAALIARLANLWRKLVRRARRVGHVDAVLVGYMGHFDVRLARRLFAGTPIILDHLISAADTARDRGHAGSGIKQRLLTALDLGAVKAADIVVVDTEAHRATLPNGYQDKGLVVAVGAPSAWFAAGEGTHQEKRPSHGRLKVVFFGLFTPLQGTPAIGEALARIAYAPIDVTMIGTGQDLAVSRAKAAVNPNVTWLDWVDYRDLPAVVAAHDVCLGIFGTSPKARRVVPNKVFQGAAAGCAIVTSDTEPQRCVLREAAIYVEPGDSEGLARALVTLAADQDLLLASKRAAGHLARDAFAPAAVVRPLVDRIHVHGDVIG